MLNNCYYTIIIQSNIEPSNMGQAYCVKLCGENDPTVENTISNLINHESDQPNHKFAKKVKQHIELHPKIKSIYLQYRTPHQPERLGIKLELYYLFQFAAYYEGEWRHGLPHGFGRVIYDDGSIYEGCFQQGVANCSQALFIKNDGSFYRGNIKDNKADGYGQLSAFKIFYKGNWKNDLPNGKAREIYSTSSFYQGNFTNGIKEGYGIYQWNLTDSYKGMFHLNKIEGKGQLTTKEYAYTGSFKNGKKQGKGQYINHAQQFAYKGNFYNDEPKGQGNIVYKDGTTFTGIFDGFQQRRGILKLLTGQQLQINTFADEIQQIIELKPRPMKVKTG